MRTLIWHQQAHNHWYLYLFSSSTPSRNTTTEYLRCKANPSVLQSPSSHGFSGTSSSEQLPSCCCLVAKSCPTLCDPTDCSTQGSSVLHYLPEFDQIHVTESVMLSNHLILCGPLLLLSSIFPRIRVLSNELALHQISSLFKSFLLVF